MIKKLLLALAVVVLGFAAYVAILPGEFRVVRSGKIGAPPDKVFALVNDLHKWDDWSPWAKLDPNAKNGFEGPDAGPGASFNWDGNDEVGAGKMTIVESKASEFVRLKLEFTRPMAGTNDTEFTFKPDNAGGTLVTWSNSGQNDFIGRAVCLFMNMDKMLGGMFEKGFANMNEVVAKS